MYILIKRIIRLFLLSLFAVWMITSACPASADGKWQKYELPAGDTDASPYMHYWVYTPDDLKPGPEMTYLNCFRYEWRKMRTAMRWPDSYQFYSLKDSGIRDLANAKGVVVARDQAGHSDVAVTNRYLKQGREVPDSVKNFDGLL